MSLRVVISACLLALVYSSELRPKIGLKIPSFVQNARIRQFPYHVSVRNGLEHICSGTLIDSEWVLTAAQCVYSSYILPSYVRLNVTVGSQSIESFEQTVRVKNAFYHGRYNETTSPYDVALLRLEKPINLVNKTVAIAKLPKSTDLLEARANLSGYGAVSYGYASTLSKRLHFIELGVENASSCGYLASPSLPLDPELHICGVARTVEYPACIADPGSPLVYNIHGERKIIGIATWSVIPCATYEAPAVFVRVSKFTFWIEEMMKNNKEKCVSLAVHSEKISFPTCNPTISGGHERRKEKKLSG